MKAIESSFNAEFIYWKIRLPKSDVTLRRRGKIVEAGWVIWYLFGSDDRGEYLDFYASHRMTNDRHVRIYANGHIEALPSIRMLRITSKDPDEDKRLEAEYLDENAEIARLLDRKGFGVTEDEPLGVLINRAMRTNAFAQEKGDKMATKDDCYPGSDHSFSSDTLKLRDFIKQLPGFVIYSTAEDGYEHMGATLTDAVLQAGINYEKVVKPRVDRMKSIPEAKSTRGFASVLQDVGTPHLLDWAEGKKTRTLEALVELLVKEHIETETGLQKWISFSHNITRLKAIKGIGDKTVDYLKILCGLESVAVDIHIRKFVAMAGLSPGSYEDVKSFISDTAKALSVPSSDLDYSIWKYMAITQKGTPNQD